MSISTSKEPNRIERLTSKIIDHVRKYCPYRYDDPETNQKDQCALLDAAIQNSSCQSRTCYAIISPYSFEKLYKGVCSIMDEMPPMEPMNRETCAYCNQPYSKTSRNQKYCSDACSEAASKKAARTRQRKHRSDITEKAV